MTTKNIHARSNAAIARYLSTEVTVKLTRGDADYIARLIRTDLNVNFDSLSDEQRHELTMLYHSFCCGN